MVRHLRSHSFEARGSDESSPPRSRRQAPPGFTFFAHPTPRTSEKPPLSRKRRLSLQNRPTAHFCVEFFHLQLKEQFSGRVTPLPLSRSEPIIGFKKRAGRFDGRPLWKSFGRAYERGDMKEKAGDMAGRMFGDPLYDWIGLFVFAALAIWFIFWIRSRFLGRDDPAALEHQMLSGLTDLRREGGLTEEEYRSIKGQLVKKLDGPARPHGDCGSRGHPEVSSVDREVDTDS